MSDGTASYVDVWSSEHDPVSERPQLTVNYTSVPEASAILLATVGAVASLFCRRSLPSGNLDSKSRIG